MGYFRHKTIVFTSWNFDYLKEVRDKGILIYERVFKEGGYPCEPHKMFSNFTGSIVNGQTSFFIAPDGSKEGWEASKLSDEAATELLKWLDNNEENYTDYTYISFGGDDKIARVLDNTKEEEE